MRLRAPVQCLHPLGLQAVIEKEKTKDYFDFQSQREEVNHSPS
jgi:hypothetical protein